MAKKIGIILCTLALTACGAMKNMDEMKKTTDNMANTTSKMESAMSDSMMALRSPISISTNKEAFDSLLKAETMDIKVKYARIYLNSFEFQGWTGANFDSAEGREELFRQSIGMFYADFQEILGSIPNIQELPMTSGKVDGDVENRVNSAMAIAMSLQEVNAHQKEFAHKRNFKTKSMLELINDGLQAYAQEKNGIHSAAKAPEYIKTTMMNIPLAMTLLTVRNNGLTMKLISMLTDLSPLKLPELIMKKWYVNYFHLDNSALAERAMVISNLIVQTKVILDQFHVAVPKVPLIANKVTANGFLNLIKQKLNLEVTPDVLSFNKIIENMDPSAPTKGLPYEEFADTLKKNLVIIGNIYKH